MSATNHRESPGFGWVQRVVTGVLPAPDGGPPLSMRYARKRFGWLLATLVGTVLGATLGFLLALAVQAVPDVPTLLVGFVVGISLGVAIAVYASLRLSRAERRTDWRVFLPLAAIGGPFLLAAVAWEALRARRRRRAKPKRR